VDWCLISADGGAAICARVESSKRAGEAGYLHRLRHDDFRPRHRVRTITLKTAGPITDFTDLATAFRHAVDPAQLADLSVQLGLSVPSLNALGIGWSSAHGAWSFPMTDAAGLVRGIRLRKPDGFKFAVTGGKEGLFLPITEHDSAAPLLITEGPTDAAALLDLTFTNIVGRPSCTGGIKHLAALAQQRRPHEVVIFSDADGPGRRGAMNLASVLRVYVPTVRVVEPPTTVKDVRAWKQTGATRADVEQLIQNAIPWRLAITTTIRGKR